MDKFDARTTDHTYLEVQYQQPALVHSRGGRHRAGHVVPNRLPVANQHRPVSTGTIVACLVLAFIFSALTWTVGQGEVVVFMVCVFILAACFEWLFARVNRSLRK